MDIFYGLVWVGLTFFMGGWGWMEVGGSIFWVGGGGGHFLWMDRDRWGWVEVYFGWVGAGGGSHSF